MESNQDVYTGLWTNYAKGRVAGATLTLHNGAYLVAFLAMFVRVTGNYAWKLLCYLVFHINVTSSPPDETQHRQQQAVLRNSYSAMDAIVKFARIALRSSKGSRFALAKSVSLSAIAALNVSRDDQSCELSKS